VLDRGDLAEATRTFGVSEAQVHRDHLIGHMLAVVSDLDVPLVFFGGTALAWTHLPKGRLSEDIDLLVADNRAVAADVVEQELPRRLRREFPGAAWDPELVGVSSTRPARLVTPGGLVVRVQLLDAERQGWSHIPTETRILVRRYRDLPQTTTRVPTISGFASMKTLAWTDRRVARDLFDLAGLAVAGALTREAADLFHQSTGRALAAHDFDGSVPRDWEASLRHQTRLLPSARECLDLVRSTYAESLAWA